MLWFPYGEEWVVLNEYNLVRAEKTTSIKKEIFPSLTDMNI